MCDVKGGKLSYNNLILEKDLPQLIVGLDSMDESANYIHIADAKENANYYCPCCKGLIKPRAYKKDKNYQVQPHYYHESGGCSEESFVHYICKTWLFEKGCKFKIKNIEYTVSSIETEKTLHTSFGDYRPDIIVNTESGKTFFFEIKYSNRKTELYAPKWDELGNDVVEVDVREFINNKHDFSIPEFKLIYSDGECFIKSYSRTDYENIIAKRKLEWKRQDKLNYKIQWERLDWFWIKLQKYTNRKIADDDIIKTFDELDYSDKLWCYYAVQKKSCVNLKKSFKKNINQYFLDMLNSFKYDDVILSLKQISPKIYEVQCRVEFLYLNYKLFEKECVKVKVQKGDILSLNYENTISTTISRLIQRVQHCKKILKKIEHISTLSYVKSITPYSHWSSKEYNFLSLLFKVEFEGFLHNKNIKETIGNVSIIANQLSESFIKEEYDKYYKIALDNLDNEFMKHALKRDTMYQDVIVELQALCKNTNYLRLDISNDNRRITLFNGHTCIYNYEYNKRDLFGIFEEEMKQKFITHIKEQIDQHIKINSYVKLVNSCKNKLWKITDIDGNFITLCLVNPKTNIELKSKCFSLCNCSDIKSEIFNNMKNLLEYIENYYGIRFMEER